MSMTTIIIVVVVVLLLMTLMGRGGVSTRPGGNNPFSPNRPSPKDPTPSKPNTTPGTSKNTDQSGDFVDRIEGGTVQGRENKN